MQITFALHNTWTGRTEQGPVCPLGPLAPGDAEIVARVSAGLGEPMVGISAAELSPEQLLETRGW